MADIQELRIGEFSIYGVVQNELEALIGMGDLAGAEKIVELLESKAGPHRRAWHLAIAARGRALLASANGDGDSALAAADEAVAIHALLPQPFELGRTLLAKGQIERRHRKRAVARVTLRQALDVFDSLGAALWAEMAADELARISGRVSAGANLTETERRVAELVAEGLSNGEIAARMFVTVRTVEAHLSRVYAKLGLRSRVDVVRWIDGAGSGT